MGRLALLVCGLLLAGPATARDYFILSLTWSPGWCATEEGADDSRQCRQGGDGFLLHGLWPQYEDGGWPADCDTRERDPDYALTRSMTDIMGSAGLAEYQWEKHGRCTGLSAKQYFDAARAAYEAVTRPPILRDLPRAVDVRPKVVEEAFLEVNPRLLGAGVTVVCRDRHLREVRICLDNRLRPRVCGRDAQEDCQASAITIDPVR